MAEFVQIPAHGAGALAALRGFLADLLRKGLVDALLVPRPAPGGDSLVQVLLDRPEALADADPFAQVMPVQSARIVSALTAGGAPLRLGAVLKPCEVRATIELAKLKQVDLTRMVLIGVDCLGTYEAADYARIVASAGHPTALALEAAAEGRVLPLPGAEFRPACRICEQPVAPASLPPSRAQPEAGGRYLAVHVLGMAGRILATGSTDLLEALGYEEGTPAAGSDDAVGVLIAGRLTARDQAFAEFHARVHDMDGLLREFSRCIRCHNCMVACPICYCKECIFRGATFDHPPLTYQGWLQRRGAVRLPADTLLFHLTRLNHMAACCVGCGLCSSACPSHLPVAEVFRAVGHEVQALFDYAAGRSLDDELPLATFREDELPGAVR